MCSLTWQDGNFCRTEDSPELPGLYTPQTIRWFRLYTCPDTIKKSPQISPKCSHTNSVIVRKTKPREGPWWIVLAQCLGGSNLIWQGLATPANHPGAIDPRTLSYLIVDDNNNIVEPAKAGGDMVKRVTYIFCAIKHKKKM